MTPEDLASLWDFSDPAGSEKRFREAFEAERNQTMRAEIQTQIARSLGLQRKFEECRAELASIPNDLIEGSARVKLRTLLETGRCINSGGDPKGSIPSFEQAYSLGRENQLLALAADAAHMLAIVCEPEDSIKWNKLVLELGEQTQDEGVLKWRASVRNNLGWTYHGLGRFDEALKEFESALSLRQGGPPKQIQIAKWCIARCLRSLGRIEEAYDIQKELFALDPEGGFINEELAELSLLLGKDSEAHPYFVKAYEVLSKDEWFVADNPERLERLRMMASQK